jgi:large subunit ribosomal protein L29
MAIGTPELVTTNLDAMDNEQLFSELKKSKEELFNLRFQAATDQLDNHGRLKAVRRDIARVYTIIRERELGIRTAPTAVAAKKADAPKKPAKTKEKEA